MEREPNTEQKTTTSQASRFYIGIREFQSYNSEIAKAENYHTAW